jgi:hypothetical protein
MLRKMRDEDMAGEQFWLYRVALRRNVTIEPTYRNETKENIAQITQAELGSSDAVRYLNTWESPGSISLAVRAQALEAVQGIRLPVEGLGAGIRPALVRKVARLRTRTGEIGAARRDEPDWLEKLRARRAAALGVPFERAPTPEQDRLVEEISKLITCEYLPGVSLTVRERFSDAMSAWRLAEQPPSDDVRFMERFAAMAAALTRPADIQRALDSETSRQL